MTNIYWKSFDDFLAMGGYGLYVWGSYAVTLLVMAAESHLAAARTRKARAAALAEGGRA